MLLWNLDTGEQSATLEGHEGSIQVLAFSPDGGRLASALDDGTVRVWDLSRIAPAPRHRDHGAGSIDFSADGSRMLTSSRDEAAWLWDARSGAPVACLNDRAMHYLEGGPPIPAYALRGDRVFSLLRGEVWVAATGAALRSPAPLGRTVLRGGQGVARVGPVPGPVVDRVPPARGHRDARVLVPHVARVPAPVDPAPSRAPAPGFFPLGRTGDGCRSRRSSAGSAIGSEWRPSGSGSDATTSLVSSAHCGSDKAELSVQTPPPPTNVDAALRPSRGPIR